MEDITVDPEYFYFPPLFIVLPVISALELRSL